MEQTEDTVALLKKLAKKAKDAKLRRRYDIVRPALQGRTKKDIASIMDMSIQGVYNILNCYEKNGIDGLQPGHSTRRKKKLTEVQEEALYKTISEKLPKDAGLAPFCNWTAPLACCYVKSEFGNLDIICGARPDYVMYTPAPKPAGKPGRPKKQECHQPIKTKGFWL